MTTLRAFACLTIGLPAILSAQTGGSISDNYRVLSVSGDAQIHVAPNLAIVSLGVETRDPGLRQARAQNDSSVQHVLQTLASLGVRPEDIQTDYLNVQIQYNNVAPNTIDFYLVEKAIGVTIRDVAGFDQLLSAVLDAGANRIYSVEFRTTELRKFRDQARAAAVKATIEKATLLATAAGLQLEPKPLGISNYNDGGGAWYGSGRPNGNMQFQSQNISQVSGGSGLQESIAPGQIVVTASVTMNFLQR